MANSFAASAFADNFITGYSFVDNIKRANRNEVRLDKRLLQEQEARKFERQRTEALDAQNVEDRDILKTARSRDREQVLRARKANKIMAAGRQADLDALQQYADIPEVAEFIAQRQNFEQDRADAEAIALSGQQVDAQEQQAAAAAAPVEGGLSQQVQALEPQDRLSPESTPTRFFTADELNELADTDLEAATAIRDEQRPGESSDPRFEQRQLFAESNMEAAVTGLPLSEAAKRNITRQEKRDAVNKQWSSFYDLKDSDGDALRSITASGVMALYFDDRESLDPDVQRNNDKRMAPKIREAIDEQAALLQTSETGSLDFRTASREMSKALGLKQAIGLEWDPPKNAGVNRGGIPVGNAPDALIKSVVAEAEAGPAIAVPIDPDQQRIDDTLLARGATGKRINERLAAAAYRRYAGGAINLFAYETFLRTGKMPAMPLVFTHHDPKDDVWATRADGSSFIFKLGRDTSAMPDILGKEPLAELRRYAKAYDSTRGDTTGTDAIRGFMAILDQNRSLVRENRLDLQNDTAGVASLFQRHLDQNIIRGALGEEWRFNGEWFPDFTVNYGGAGAALFNTAVDRDFDTEGLEEIGLEAGDLTPLRAGLRTDIDFDGIRAKVGDPNLSDEEILAEINRRGQ